MSEKYMMDRWDNSIVLLNSNEVAVLTIPLWFEELEEEVKSIMGELNELHEEIQQLRELLDIGKTNAKAIIDVLNEQEQYKIKANELEKENKQLKQRIKELEE